MCPLNENVNNMMLEGGMQNDYDHYQNQVKCNFHGAMVEETRSAEGNGHYHNGPSVFNILLSSNPKAAEVLLDQMISTNGKEKDSSDFLLVYDLELFDKETCRDGGDINEMALHSKLIGNQWLFNN